jgi:hypothetical protein
VALQTGSTFKASIVQIGRSRVIQGFVNGSPLDFTGERLQVGVRKFAANGSPLTNQGYPFALSQTPGACSVIKVKGSDIDYIDLIDIATLLNSPLDAGPSFTLSGPAGSKSVDASNGTTTLSQGSDIPGVPSMPPFLQDGNYTLAFPGGRDIGAVQAKFILQNQFNANFPTSITKGKPLTLTWSGGNDGDLVRMFLTGLAFSGAAPLITCTANATDHTFTVPGDLTGQLVSDVPTGVLGFYALGAPISFSAPLIAGGNLDSAKIVTATAEIFTAIGIQ